VIDNDNATNSTTTAIIVTTPETPTLEVVINEIAWMGTATSSWDEWIELYNNTDSPIDLSNWTLAVIQGTTPFLIEIATSTNLSTSTAATTTIHVFYLLERAEKATNILADFVYGKQRISNTGAKLELRDGEGNLIDKVGCFENEQRECVSWFAGTTTLRYVSMERISSTSTATSTNWANNNQITKNGLDANGNKIYGTPRAENSVSKSQTEIAGTVDYPTLTYLGNPYIVTSMLTIPYENTLTIEPGVTLKFDNNAGLDVSGTLKAISQEDRKIIFTSLNELSYWQGIYFNSSSTNSELIWTEIKYGRRCLGLACGEPPAILVENSSIVLASSTIENYTDRGLKLVNSSSTIEKVNFLGSGIGTSTVGIEIENGSPIIKDCLIKENRIGIFIEFLATEDLPTVEGNNFEGNVKPISGSAQVIFKLNRAENDNQINGILIGGSISKNHTWYKNDIPYLIGEPPSVGGSVDVYSGVTLVIEPGVRIEFGNGASLEINGTLLARGTAEEPIIFTAYPGGIVYGPQAPWGRIYFSASSTNSILENVIISQGGG